MLEDPNIALEAMRNRISGGARKGIKSITKALTAKKGWAGAKLKVRRGVKTIEITLP